MLLFDLTSDRSASWGHISHPENSNIRVDLKGIARGDYMCAVPIFLKIDRYRADSVYTAQFKFLP